LEILGRYDCIFINDIICCFKLKYYQWICIAVEARAQGVFGESVAAVAQTKMP
jgi:hypothetical protein